MSISVVSLLERFPREIGRPFKEGIVWNLDEINSYIKKYGSSHGIHISVYPYSTIDQGKVDYESAIIDKIFFDIDPPDWLEPTRKLFKWCYNYNLLSTFIMSGGGSHDFIYCKETIKNKRSCIHNFQSYLENKIKIRMDPQVKGDLSQTFRIPETFNFKRGRYSIYLDKDLLFNKTEKEIYEIASKYPIRKPKRYFYGEKLLNLSKFDVEDFMYSIDSKLSTPMNGDLYTKDELDKLNIPFDKFPPCVKSWLNNPELGYKGRFCLVIYLRDQTVTKVPIPFKVIVSILKIILSNDMWLHTSTNLRLSNHHEGEGLRPVKKAYSNLKYKMYSCYQLRDFNLCPEKCGRWHPIFD